MALGFIFAGIAVGCMIAGGVFWFAGRKAQEPAGWVRKDRYYGTRHYPAGGFEYDSGCTFSDYRI